MKFKFKKKNMMRQKLVQTEADKTHAWKAVESMFQVKKGKKTPKSGN